MAYYNLSLFVYLFFDLPIYFRENFDIFNDGLESRQQQVKLSHIFFPA